MKITPPNSDFETVTLSAKYGDLFDNVAALPKGTSFAITAADGKPLFVARHALGLDQAFPQTPTPPSVAELLKSSAEMFGIALAESFGIPATSILNHFRPSPALKTADFSSLQRRGPAATPFLTPIIGDLRRAVVESKANPGAPPQVFPLGDATLAVRGGVTYFGNLKVNLPPSRPTIKDALAAPHATDVAESVRDIIEGLRDCTPQLAHQLQVAGGIVDCIILGTGSADFMRAVRESDNKAVVGCTLSLGGAGLELAAGFTGQASLKYAAFVVKSVLKPGWTLYVLYTARTRSKQTEPPRLHQ